MGGRDLRRAIGDSSGSQPRSSSSPAKPIPPSSATASTFSSTSAGRAFQSLISAESAASLLEVELPMVLHDTPGGKEELKRLAGGLLDELIDRIEEQTPPTSWASQIEFIQGDLPPIPVNLFVTSAALA